MYVQREPTRMYSLVIERENRCRLANRCRRGTVDSKSKAVVSPLIMRACDCEFANASRSGGFNGHAKMSVQFSKHHECFL